jgi:[calcium/calmodulin-dependent protein kinase] kinase
LNQYILTDDIGRGSFGVVQKAKDVNTGTEYAVKEFSKMRLRKRAQSEMIRRQGRGAAMRRGAVPMRRQPQPRTGQGGKGGDEGVQVQEEEDKHSDNDLDLIRE